MIFYSFTSVENYLFFGHAGQLSTDHNKTYTEVLTCYFLCYGFPYLYIVMQMSSYKRFKIDDAIDANETHVIVPTVIPSTISSLSLSPSGQISRLPTDVMLLIIQLLDTQSQITVLQLVCTRWNALTRSSVNLSKSWCTVSDDGYSEWINDDAVIRNLPEYIIPHLRNLDISGLAETDPAMIEIITRRFTCLRSLTLLYSDTSNEGDYIDLSSLSTLVNLVTLVIEFDYSSFTVVIDLPPTVRNLKLYQTGDAWMNVMISDWSNLTSLNLRGDYVIIGDHTQASLPLLTTSAKQPPNAYAPPAAHSLVNLTRLNLRFDNNKAMTSILRACLPWNLTSLSISCKDMMSIRGVMSSFCGLTHLSMSFYCGEERNVDIFVQPHLDTLQTLHITFHNPMIISLLKETGVLTNFVYRRLTRLKLSLTAWLLDEFKVNHTLKDIQALITNQMPQVANGQIKLQIVID